jgi:ABC-2 type transport system permease protein
MTTATLAGTSPAQKVLALAVTEIKLVMRNRTMAVSTLLVPVALGVFWAFSFGGGPEVWPMVVALQAAVTLGMGLYLTATQTVVARRHTRVLTRMRTSGISDPGLLTATLAPAIAIALVQIVVFALIDLVMGVVAPVNPLALVAMVLAGVALMVTAALATSVVTPSPERAQITTLPLVFVMLGGAIAMAVIPAEGWLQALLLVPGAAVGTLVRLAFGGEIGMGAVTGTIVATVALLAWAGIFARVAQRKFRWDPRNG